MKKKMRINITVDTTLLHEAKKKLNLFGGKLSTLFNAYLRDFVASMDKEYGADYKALRAHIQQLEQRLKKLEEK